MLCQANEKLYRILKINLAAKHNSTSPFQACCAALNIQPFITVNEQVQKCVYMEKEEKGNGYCGLLRVSFMNVIKLLFVISV